jgi:hypothetical protein
MKLIRQVQADTALLDFAASEMDSSRWRPHFERCIGAPQVLRLRSKGLENWTVEDQGLALRALDGVRGVMVRPLVGLEPEWWDAAVDLTELPACEATAGSWWGNLSPNWDLGSFIDSFEAGLDTPEPGYRKKVYDLAASFDADSMVGRPILVGEKPGVGALTVLEGTTRLLALLKRKRDGRSVPVTVGTYTGFTPRIDNWGYRPVRRHGPTER